MTTWPFCIHTPTEVALHFVKLKGSKGTNSSRGRYHATQDSYPYVPCCFWFNTHTHTNTHMRCADQMALGFLPWPFFFLLLRFSQSCFLFLGRAGRPFTLSCVFYASRCVTPALVFFVCVACVCRNVRTSCAAHRKSVKNKPGQIFSQVTPLWRNRRNRMEREYPSQEFRSFQTD